MKNLALTYILFTAIIFSGTKTTDSKFQTTIEKEVIATFDGAEGNYYFFTDSERKALQFEELDLAAKNKFDLITGDYVGKVFEISYEGSKILDLKKKE
ncbi:hypothetical protein FDT66_08270 [Polaribacter aestuariivivens]|uniref:Uncharacterized protein n=1 Tax=Polaribacter aestuariivivens TaxID=2304626 RepID=A0A5S3N3D1_9FLAO|nr:hypothetical protein [Polaribacter aestuariivivens]TMM29858.1 hypothetical protein FDT66_08270 [Polaribacter aestuariivivens]